ncbi:hypothetical protein C0J52_27148 [Blattella germanica]|nr:hypothetical protein C0J52_27148 [Blattella germanica]
MGRRWKSKVCSVKALCGIELFESMDFRDLVASERSKIFIGEAILEMLVLYTVMTAYLKYSMSEINSNRGIISVKAPRMFVLCIQSTQALRVRSRSDLDPMPRLPLLQLQVSTIHERTYTTRQIPPYQLLIYENSGRDVSAPVVGPLTEGSDLVLTCEVRGVKPLSVRLLSKPKVFVADTEYVITCETIGSRPQAKILWYRENKEFRRGKFEASGNETMVMSTVTFSPSPDDDGHVLKCKGENPMISGSGLEDSLSLNVRPETSTNGKRNSKRYSYSISFGKKNYIKYLTFHIIESEKVVGIEDKRCVVDYHVHQPVIAVQRHFRTRFDEDPPSGASILTCVYKVNQTEGKDKNELKLRQDWLRQW